MGMTVMTQMRFPSAVLLTWLHKQNRSKGNAHGFTLIELLVVIVIGGILSAIALPSFLNQANKARESEGRVYVSTVNKAQQTYFLQQSRFSPSIVELGLGIGDSDNYAYLTVLGTDAGDDIAYTTADQINPALRSFSGQVWNGVSNNSLLTFSVFCEGDAGDPPPPITGHACP